MNRPGINPRLRPFFPKLAPPPLIRHVMEEVVARFGVSHDAAFLAILAVISVATRGRFRVRHPHGGVGNAEIYACYIKRSGDRATAMLDYVARVLREHDEEATRRHQAEMSGFVTRSEAWSTINDGLRRKLAAAAKRGHATEPIEREMADHASRKPEKPRLIRLNSPDTTKRAIVEALEGDNRHGALLTDEGHIVLFGDLIEENGLLNLAWDGNEISLARAHGVTISALRPHLTLLVVVQEQVMLDYLKRHGATARGSGFLARFLMAHPASLIGYRIGTSVERPPSEHMQMFHARIRELLQEGTGPSDEIVHGFDTDATARWHMEHDLLEVAQRPGGDWEDMSDYASKAMNNISRVSALFHHFNGGVGPITLDTLVRARDLVQYFLGEAKRFLMDDPAQAELEDDVRRLEGYLHKKVREGWAWLPRRYIYRCGPIRNDPERFEAALAVLVSLSRVYLSVPVPRKPVNVYMNQAYFRSLDAKGPDIFGPLADV